ncbi:DUF7146 domain-containing protein [Methylobacterium frigidaeris]|uniref:DNA primase n=1 Tax=Methylobacterium frigidaeris TaxID=2038277 RepID=A0AA37M7U3_9HYPH|nr:CHC2 zinc finger domain-containing protein [Methylobacterium frigidaeris]GJD65156.1 DNA primase [Methylobacterium frigidaeris]
MARDRDAAFDDWTQAARAVGLAEVASRYNLALRGSNERVGPCPVCGGRDRFGINLRKGVFLCRGCGKGGDAIALVMLVEGCDFLAACEILTGQAPPRGEGSTLSVEERAALEAERAEKRAAHDARSAAISEDERRKARGIYAQSEPAPGTPVETYLREIRGVDLPRHGCAIRFHPNLAFFDDRTVKGVSRKVKVHAGPAMVGGIVGPDGLFSGVHLTWLDLDAPSGKAQILNPETGEVAPAKKMRGSVRGGYIPLTRPAEPLSWCMGEGIETTLSVRTALERQDRDTSRTAFACALSLGGLGGPAAETVAHPTIRNADKRGHQRPWMIPGPVPDMDGPAIAIPDSVVSVLTLGDGDSDPVLTRYAHDRAAARYARDGRRVRAAFAPEGSDFNSLLLRGL